MSTRRTSDVPGQLPLIPDAPLPAIETRDAAGAPIQVECAGCHRRHDPADMHDIDGDNYCPDCCGTCDDCGGHFSTDNLSNCLNSERPTHESIRCNGCSWECDDCGDRFYGNAASNDSGNRICYGCAEHYYCCEACGEVVHESNIYLDVIEEQTLCEHCYRRREADRENEGEDEDEDDPRSSVRPVPASRGPTCRVFSYSYKPALIFHPEYHPQTVYFGLEIEIDAPRLQSLVAPGQALYQANFQWQSLFYAKADGSVARGVELVSYPATRQYWHESADLSFLPALAKIGYRAYDTETAGFHVHVSRAALSSHGIAKLLYFCRENAAFMLFASRRNSRDAMHQWAAPDNAAIPRALGPHLRPCRDSVTCLQRSIECSPMIQRAYYGNSHDERYKMINLENENTIEFRIFRGTMNRVSILRNLDFAAALVQFVRLHPPHAMRWIRFVQWVERDGKHTLGRHCADDLADWLETYAGATAPADIDEETSLVEVG